MTNEEKYIETFGMHPENSVCINKEMQCPSCGFSEYLKRDCAKHWWSQEWKQPSESEPKAAAD